MAILHTLRSFRHLAKGYLLRSRICPDPANPPKVLTSRQLVLFRHTDLFGHVNNSRYIEMMELSRWEVFSASGFNQKLLKHRIFPVVAGVQITYFREIKPFQVATIQIVGIGICAKGNQFVMTQHIYDAKKRLCATAIFHVSLLSWKTNKPLKIRDALRTMGIDQNSESSMLILEGENNPDFSLENVDHFLKLAQEKGGIHHNDFFPKVDEHNSTHPAALASVVRGAAHFTDAAKHMRNWIKTGSAKKNNFAPEDKSETKK